MNPAELFVRRPVGTTLLTIGIALAGMLAFYLLPVSPLPQVDFPTIQVQAQMPGASPDTMAATVATPLERHLGQIADVTEMTSTSSVGNTRITLQFGLDRDIDGAARDVQAAISAARADLPTSLRSNPTYRKVNPADAPVLILALTSKTLSQGQLYDSAATVLQQKLSQVAGIGQVTIGGSSLPAVRVELQPESLFKYGIGLEDVRAALASANANAPKGVIETGERRFQVYTNDQASKAAQYQNLIVAYRNQAPVFLHDVANVIDSVEDLRNQGLANGQPAVLIVLFRQPNANIIDTVDRVLALIPELQAAIPADITISRMMDRTSTIRASLSDVEQTLLISIALVVAVVFVFLRNGRASLIPSVAVPVSLVGTFGAMYLLNFSLDNLSLMALTIATGFVVDDAIVVLENVERHIEDGLGPFEAAVRGAGEVSYTVVAMSISLVAVFVPILLMGGIVGRYLREFGLTLSLAVLISLVLSLTTTPMMCALVLRRRRPPSEEGRLSRSVGRVFDGALHGYERSLDWSLGHRGLMLMLLGLTVVATIYLYVVIPKGFFPQQDTGRLMGGIQADQSISFQLMRQKLKQFVAITQSDPAVESVAAFSGGQQTNTANLFVALKPLGERKISADQVIARLRPRFGEVAGARLFLASAQDIRVGGRQSNALYQYTLLDDDLPELYAWGPRVLAALLAMPELTEVNSDQQQNGLEIDLAINRDRAMQLGLSPSQIDSTLYDAFGQRQVSTIYNDSNQYHVVMEVAPAYWQSPQTLDQIYVSTAGGAVGGTASTGAVAGTVTASTVTTTAASLSQNVARNAATNSLASSGKGGASTGAAVSTASESMIPLSSIASFAPGNTPLGVNHQGPFAATTISFNLAPGVSLGTASQLIQNAMAQLHVPATIKGSFAGTAAQFQSSLATEPLLILAALGVIYIVLGVLYESYIHPITILSTLPSAGAGAVLALRVTNTDFSIIALVGVILLIGIVKKNAIMMIDFALEAERQQGLEPLEAIREACLLRFRPIMMTTAAALLGALPLAFGTGTGSELRQPLGIAIVGGLIVSQALTLYTTPVMYLLLDRFAQRRDPRPRPLPLLQPAE